MTEKVFFRNRYPLMAVLLLLSTGVGYVVINANTTNSSTEIKPAITNKKIERINNLLNSL